MTTLDQTALTETSAERSQAYILVVEDEELLASAIKAIFAESGHRVETAANGVEGFEKFQRNRFDIVFSDHAMPEMNGMELAELVKSISPQTPFVMVTAYANLMRKKNDKNTNIDSIVSKPFQPEELLAALKTYLC